MTLLTPTFGKRILFFAIADILIFYLALQLAYSLRFDFVIPSEFYQNFPRVFGVLLLLKLLFMVIFRLYSISWRFFSLEDSKRLIKAHLAATVSFITLYALFSDFFAPMPRSVIVIDLFLSLLLTGALRISKRIMLEQLKQGSDKAALIIGVNQKTSAVIRSALDGNLGYFPMGIIAVRPENQSAVGTFINNVRVHDLAELGSMTTEKNIGAAIITGDFNTEEMRSLFEQLKTAGITEIKRAKLLGSQYEKLEDLSIEELLARHPKDLDTQAIAGFIKGKSVLITGGGGSIGSEIALQCQKFGASHLSLLDNSEFNLYTIGEQLPQASLHLTSVTDAPSLQQLFNATRFDIVIHAAAYKHVPICEANPHAAVVNNVLGTKNIIDCSIAAGVGKVVIISTDKAVRPTNIMGATKRVTELYAQNVDAGTTEIVSVRFGNVLGSSGSVIPKFKRQIENGENLTVTHPEMTRYFMMIPEACQLVLQAASIAKGGELFILDMGKPVKIVDLARQMIKLYGKEQEIDIEFTGLRPGEKMFEELLISDEEQKTKYTSIYITNPTPCDTMALKDAIRSLLETDDKVASLKAIVPEFSHQP
jgi:UDP-N-acetyl-D-glucosamine 4,6-dehydratase